jgi:hypothetical protein
MERPTLFFTAMPTLAQKEEKLQEVYRCEMLLNR